MHTNENKSLDVLGIKPVACAIEKVTEGTVDGARAFLARICLPAAEEFGLLLQDHVKSWRARNANALAQEAEDLVRKHHGARDVKVNPRIAHAVFEEGSWIEDEITRKMWAGLLASACDERGGDDSNIVFIGLLKQMTAMQATILRYSVESAEKYLSSGGWPYAHRLNRSIDELMVVCQCDDIQRIDRELDHLRGLELIHLGFSPDEDTADIAPTGLALHLYTRGEGFPGSPVEYWDMKKQSAPVSSEGEAASSNH